MMLTVSSIGHVAIRMKDQGQCWTEDPDGHRIELMQMASESRQSEAIASLKQG